MTAVIETHDLTKDYGSIRAVSSVNLEVHQGEVFGYLGQNGAGKTTTIRIFLDFIRPTSGSASVFGLDSRLHSQEIRRRVDYLAGDVALYERMTGRQLLTYLASLRGGVDWRYVDGLATRFQANLDQSIRSLSKGNRQKLGLIQAFMSRPELIIMDEPTSGLDPLMQQEFYKLVEETKADGCTVFISSHIVPEVERLCDRVGIIRQGRLVAVESVMALREKALRQIRFEFAEPVPAEAFANLPGVQDLTIEGTVLRSTIMGKVDALVKAAANFEVVNVVSEDGNLEDIFLEFYTEEDADAE